MKGNQELVDALNGLLASELTSINQYMVHAEMAEDWGYTRLSENFKKRSITEMKHAERLIERILFLEGTPIVSHLNDMHIGAEIPQQVNNDHAWSSMRSGSTTRPSCWPARCWTMPRATSSKPSCATRTRTSTSWKSCRTRSSR